MQGSATTTGIATDLVEGQEGQPTCTALFEQLDGTGSDAIVINDDLGKTSASGHLKGKPVAIVDLSQLSDQAMDAIEASLEEQTQSTGAPALLEGFTAAVVAGNVAFKLLLLLLQANAGALLQLKCFSQLLDLVLVLGHQLKQLLLSLLQLLQLFSSTATALLLTR